jgi:hypothetical protein
MPKIPPRYTCHNATHARIDSDRKNSKDAMLEIRFLYNLLANYIAVKTRNVSNLINSHQATARDNSKNLSNFKF